MANGNDSGAPGERRVEKATESTSEEGVMMTATETFDEMRERRAHEQERVNVIYRALGTAEAMKEIRHLAERDHAEYPQYEGYWEGERWTLAECTWPIRSKGGMQAMPGDVVLYREGFNGMTFTIAWGDDLFYSVRLGWCCSAGYGVQVIRSRHTGEPVR